MDLNSRTCGMQVQPINNYFGKIVFSVISSVYGGCGVGGLGVPHGLWSQVPSVVSGIGSFLMG